MALVSMLYFCAARFDIHIMVTHIAATTNIFADALSCSQVRRFKQLAPNAADLMHGLPSFGETAHLIPIIRCCSINLPDLPNWDPFIFAILDKFTISPFPASPLLALLLLIYCWSRVSQNYQGVFIRYAAGTP